MTPLWLGFRNGDRNVGAHNATSGPLRNVTNLAANIWPETKNFSGVNCCSLLYCSINGRKTGLRDIYSYQFLKFYDYVLYTGNHVIMCVSIYLNRNLWSVLRLRLNNDNSNIVARHYHESM